jgi:hypothetical protein
MILKLLFKFFLKGEIVLRSQETLFLHRNKTKNKTNNPPKQPEGEAVRLKE